MEVLFNLPVWMRDMGIFASLILSLILLLAYSPFAFRISFEGQFLVGKNGKRVKEIADAAESPGAGSDH